VRPDVVLGSAQRRGPARFHLVKQLDSGRSFEVGDKEHFVISRLDGTRTLGEIGEAYAATYQRGLGQANWAQILGALHQRDLLAGAPARPRPAGPPPTPSKRRGRHRRERRRLLHGTVVVTRDPTRLLDRLHAVARPLFSPWLAVPLLAGLLALTVLLARDGRALVAAAARADADPGLLFVVGALLWVANAAHELAHGVAARHHRVAVQEIGIRWTLLLVLLYCRVDDYRYLPRRRSQVVVAAAGIVANLVLVAPAYAVWRQWPGTPVADGAAAFVVSSVLLVVLNALPLPPLDGYQMLSQSLGMAEYARHSALFTLALVTRGPRAVRAYPWPARVAYTGYAAGVGLAAGGLVAGLVVAGRQLTGGWLLPVLVAVVVFLVLPAVALLGTYYGNRARARAAGALGPGAAADTGSAGRPGAADDAEAGEPSARAGSEPAIRLTGIRKTYGARTAVDGVTLEVRRGEFLGLLGPNGAGKTTLVEIAVGLRRADSGTVSLLGRSPLPRDVELLPRVGMQTQAAAFFVRLTAGEHLRTVAALYGLGRSAADRALRLVGLQDLAEVRAERLSGGQRQRLAIAAALVHDPEVIFLDEPTAALDPQARRALWSVLRDLHSSGRTIVYTTHHLDEAEALCDRVAIVTGGRVVALDSPRRLVEATGAADRLLVPRDRLSAERAAALPGVSGVHVDGADLVLETHDSTSVLARLAAMSGLHGVRTRSLTLEDVYLELTGSAGTEEVR
jgi:ABC-type multidrug transport system ATPase subunit